MDPRMAIHGVRRRRKGGIESATQERWAPLQEEFGEVEKSPEGPRKAPSLIIKALREAVIHPKD